VPRASVWLIRSALVCLALGFTLGALMLGGKGLGWTAELPRAIPAHVELVVTGWMIQLAMGVALWILPRFGVRGPARREAWGWLAWGLLNSGIAMVVLGQAFAGRLCELAAILAFAGGVWSRVRASGLSAM